MAIVQMIPPTDGKHNTISIKKRTYSTTNGVPIPVPDFDADTLQANGWTVLPVASSVAPGLSFDLAGIVSGVNPIYNFQTVVSPTAPTAAVVPGLVSEIDYPIGAASITGAGHLVGVLGFIVNQNTTNTLPLAIGSEGKIQNNAGCTITNAVCTDHNLGANAGTIGNLFMSYADLASNAGTISLVAPFTAQVINTGTITNYAFAYLPNLTTPGIITNLYGLYFANQTGGAIGTKFCVNCLDANAPIKTIGQVQTNTLQLDSGTKTATAVAGAATLNKASGKITTEALTTAAGATYTLTLTNSQIAAADTVFASVDNGTNTTPDATVTRVTPGAGTVVILVKNTSASALNGTLVISFMSLKA